MIPLPSVAERPHQVDRGGRSELIQVIADESVTTVFQPLVSLQTGEVFAYEALSRGPRGSRLERPDVLFSLAERNGLLVSLERICRKKALEAKKAHLPPGSKLCLNVDPRVIRDPQFRSGQTLRLLGQLGINPQEIILEITERSMIADFPTFLAALAHYRDQGYYIAVDDVGAGYASLRAVIEIRPNLIKLDAGLVGGAPGDPIKQALLAALADFAHRVGTALVAEGIETAEELALVRDLGIDYGQGFLLARPACPPPPVAPEASALLPGMKRRVSRSGPCARR